MASSSETGHRKPLTCLRKDTLVKLSESLNPKKILLKDDKYLRDWRGIAVLMDCSTPCIRNLENQQDQFGALIQMRGNDFEIPQLLSWLEVIDRHDVIDDHKALIERDAENVRELPNATPVGEDSAQFVTIYDADHLKKHGELPVFDAFLIYAEEDKHFAERIIGKMEEHNYKFITKDHLLLGLIFEHLTVVDLISSRCRFLLPIYSPDFLKTRENTFFVNSSQALGIQNNSRKLVPVVYKDCQLPQIITMYSRLHYREDEDLSGLMWEKLRRSMARDQEKKDTEQETKRISSNSKKNVHQPSKEMEMLKHLPSPPTEKPQHATTESGSKIFGTFKNVFLRKKKTKVKSIAN